MKIAVGCDHAGFELKQEILSFLNKLGYEPQDLGTYSPEPVDYPHYASKLALAVARHEAEHGILICGSGIGMCMTANRVPGIRAVQASNPFEAKMSRRHNNSNVLCLGSRFLGLDLALDIVETWLGEPFQGGRHQRRVDLMDALDILGTGISGCKH